MNDEQIISVFRGWFDRLTTSAREAVSEHDLDAFESAIRFARWAIEQDSQEEDEDGPAAHQ